MIFTKVAVSFCKSVSYIEKTLYYYMDNPYSLMHDTRLLDKQNAHKAYEIIKQKLNGRSFEKEIESIYLIEIIYSTTMTCIRKKEDAGKNFKEVAENYNFGNTYNKKYALKYRIIILIFRIGLCKLVEYLVR